MIRSGVDLALTARANNVTRAVVLIAKERTTTMHALLLVRFGGIEGRIGPLWVPRYFAILCQLRVIIGTIPIAAPSPDVARHVEEAVLIREKLRDWSDPGVSIRS